MFDKTGVAYLLSNIEYRLALKSNLIVVWNLHLNISSERSITFWIKKNGIYINSM